MQTVAVVNFLVTHADVSRRAAYQMTKPLFENLPELDAAHDAAKQSSWKSAQRHADPLHPGAERYYKEKGMM